MDGQRSGEFCQDNIRSDTGGDIVCTSYGKLIGKICSVEWCTYACVSFDGAVDCAVGTTTTSERTFAEADDDSSTATYDHGVYDIFHTATADLTCVASSDQRSLGQTFSTFA